MRRVSPVLVLIFILAMVGCGKKEYGVRTKPIPVKVWKVTEEKYSIFRPVVGYLKGEESDLTSSIGGRVERIYKKEGDRVRKGDYIAGINTSLFEARLKMAESQLNNSRDEFERIDNLYKKGLVSKSQWEKAKLALTMAELQKKVAEKNYRLSFVVAPIDGYVDFFQLKSGEVVSPGRILGKVVDDKSFEVDAYLPVEGISIARGDTVKIRWSKGVLEGVVTYISTSYMPGRNFRKMVIKVKRPYRGLVSGAAATVMVPVVKDKVGILVPLDSVKFMKEGKSVFIVEEGKAREIPVVTGDIVGEKIEILDGLKTGELLVVEGQHYLKTGVEVLVK